MEIDNELFKTFSVLNFLEVSFSAIFDIRSREFMALYADRFCLSE